MCLSPELKEKMASVILEGVTCAVCLGFMQDPKHLDCGHTFCLKCLARICESTSHQYLSCPLCRHVTIISGGDISALPTNLMVKGLVADLKLSKLTSKFAKTATDHQPPGSLSLLKQLNHNFGAGANQNIDDTDNEHSKVTGCWNKKCEKHPDHDLELYCETCQKGVCFICCFFVCEKDGHSVAQKSHTDDTTIEQHQHPRAQNKLESNVFFHNNEIKKEQNITTECKVENAFRALHGQNFDDTQKASGIQPDDLRGKENECAYKMGAKTIPTAASKTMADGSVSKDSLEHPDGDSPKETADDAEINPGVNHVAFFER